MRGIFNIAGLFTLLFCGSLSAFTDPETHQFTFYGVQVEVQAEKKLKSVVFPDKAISYISVARSLNTMHELKLDETIAQLKIAAKQMALDNVGFMQLMKLYSQRCFPAQTINFRKALVWYGLRQNGTDALVAGSTDYFNVFVVMENSPDGGFSLSHQGKKYVSISNDKYTYSLLEVYKLQLLQDSARAPLQLDVFTTPRLGMDIRYQQRKFEYNDHVFTLNTRYNQHLVNYLNDLPSFRIGSYLYTYQPSDDAQYSLDDSLKYWLRGKTYNDQLTFLLALVQSAFPYKADSDYRAREKRNFVEQTLADKFVDCEDKAALFCYLATKYLSADCVLLYSRSQTHVCCAIELPDKAPGYTFRYLGKPYLVCEPAFEGLKPGETELTQDEILRLEVYN
ncbi:MAG: hypothetical protein JNL57_10640 [Bacteroidetes bacterium]|nr:hypothetical protein [Bacteroidota bacterium]